MFSPTVLNNEIGRTEARRGCGEAEEDRNAEDMRTRGHRLIAPKPSPDRLAVLTARSTFAVEVSATYGEWK